jgi:hypothetical protein
MSINYILIHVIVFKYNNNDNSNDDNDNDDNDNKDNNNNIYVFVYCSTTHWGRSCWNVCQAVHELLTCTTPLPDSFKVSE